MAKKLIPMAISYDFDGTLAPGNMQEYDFIPALNMRSKHFWSSVTTLAAQHEMDQILAYMYMMLEEARKSHVAVRRNDFKNFGAKITLFPGVQDWFKRINAYAKEKVCGWSTSSYPLEFVKWWRERQFSKSSKKSMHRVSCSTTMVLRAGRR